MPDPTTGRGFLADLGLTDLNEEQASLAKQRAQFGLGVQEAIASIDNQTGISPAERDARKVGAIFGNFFGSRKVLGGGQLDDEEKSGIAAVQAAQEKLKELKRVTPGMSQELESEKFKQILAGELAMVNLTQQSIEVGKAAQQEFRARRTQEIELKRLGIAADRDGIAKKLDQGKATRELRGQVNPIWPKGATREDEAVMGFMQNDGTVVGQDGQTFDLGQYSIFPPPVPRGNGLPATANDLGISDREQKEIRDQVAAVGAMARGGLAMRDALAEASQAGDGVNIMDGTGTLTGGFVKILEVIGGIGRQIGATLDVVSADGEKSQGNLATGGSAAKYVAENFTEIDGRLLNLVPDNLRNSEVSRAKYYSALTRITFAQARANEPGNRVLSDEDFKRSLVQMAGNASDPDAFRQVMNGNMKEAVEALDLRNKIIGEDRMKLIVSPAGIELMNKELATYRRAFKDEFGTAADPSAAILNDRDSGVRRVGGATFTPDR
jgi:hypothetical protein